MLRRLAPRVVIGAATLLFATASCGGDDDGDSGAGSAATTAEAPETSDVTAVPGGPRSAEEAAQALYDAWRAGDHAAAQDVSEMDAQTVLFTTPGADADWTFQGCVEGDAERVFDCAFSYEGGAATMRTALTGLYGWRVLAVTFTAD